MTSTGLPGCHGGSGLSGLGGSVRVGEVSGAAPIRHALKISLNCKRTCSTAGGGFRWPATKADGYFEDQYGGTLDGVRMGSLLAVPPDTDIAGLATPTSARSPRPCAPTAPTSSTTPPARAELAVGAGRRREELPNVDSDEMQELFGMLDLVDNNTAATPGGGPLGSPRRAPCAGPFADGTGGAPPGC